MRALKHRLFRFRAVIIIFAILFIPVAVSANQAGLKLQKAKFGKNTIHYFYVNTRNGSQVARPAFSPGYSEIDRNYPVSTMSEMTRLYRPAAIINGTFFDSRNRRTVCNVAVGGKLICEGDRGSTIYVDKSGKAGIILTSRLKGRNIKWSDFQWAVSSGPTLLFNGRIVLNPKQEGFRDGALFRPTCRTGMGITGDGRLLIAVTGGSLKMGDFAKIMGKLGAVHAINLDGGSSSGLGFKNSYPVKPKRKLANFILFYENPCGRNLPDYPCISLLLKGRDLMTARHLRKKAESFSKAGNISAAVNYHLKACRILPWETSLSIDAAKALEESGRNRLASKFYGRAAANALDFGAAGEADQWARKALESDPDNGYAREVQNNLRKNPGYIETVIMLRDGDTAGAYHKCMELVKTDGSNPRFYFLLARVFTAMERDDLKARAFYLSSLYFKKMKDRNYESYLAAKHAVEAQPQDHRYRLLLSAAALSIGDKNAAGYHRFLAGHLAKTENKSRKLQIERLFGSID